MSKELIKQIVAKYDEDDDNFATWANKEIADHFLALKPSSSKIDPQRLGSQSVLISKVRKALLDKAGPVEVPGREMGMKEFNSMNIREQLKFQARARMNGDYKWVHEELIIPANIAAIKMPEAKIQEQKKIRYEVDTGKLRAESVEVDGDRLLAKLMPNLLGAKRHMMAAAVLLATGRRTTEMLLSGELYLANGNTMDGYKCMFKGQLKQGLDNDKPYEIPLLAPYHAVKKAWDELRELYPTVGMTSEEVNQAYAATINNYTQRVAGLTPHRLRECYALMTYEGQEKKMSLVGWISKVLGHSQPGCAAYYQRMKIVDYSGPWKVAPFQPVEKKVAANEPLDLSGWDLNGAAELKRLPGLLEMIEKKVKITATSMRTHAGGTMVVLQRILEKNQKLIDDYNASLE